MRALTLWQPWAWLVGRGHKLVENRPWKPSPTMLRPGERFAIHAGKTFEVGAWPELIEVARERRIQLPAREELFFGGVIATARFCGWVDKAADVDADQRVWFAGPIGWILDEVVELPTPVATPGWRARAIWLLPGHILLRVEELEELA